ncbi:MAG: hypothetical protein ACKVG9_14810, partial [Rhodospirillales bacterium]
AAKQIPIAIAPKNTRRSMEEQRTKQLSLGKPLRVGLGLAQSIRINLTQTFHKSTEYWLLRIRFADTGRLMSKRF